jgi:hypothetical protein
LNLGVKDTLNNVSGEYYTARFQKSVQDEQEIDQKSNFEKICVKLTQTEVKLEDKKRNFITTSFRTHLTNDIYP